MTKRFQTSKLKKPNTELQFLTFETAGLAPWRTHRQEHQSGPVKVKGGTRLPKGGGKLARSTGHYKEVLNRPEPVSPARVEPTPLLSIDTTDFTEEDIQKAAKGLKNNEPPGVDGVTVRC
ncbi:hypothetical protein ACOMHN_010514 [Nucella lapillus]